MRVGAGERGGRARAPGRGRASAMLRCGARRRGDAAARPATSCCCRAARRTSSAATPRAEATAFASLVRTPIAGELFPCASAAAAAPHALDLVHLHLRAPPGAAAARPPCRAWCVVDLSGAPPLEWLTDELGLVLSASDAPFLGAGRHARAPGRGGDRRGARALRAGACPRRPGMARGTERPLRRAARSRWCTGGPRSRGRSSGSGASWACRAAASRSASAR